MPKQRISYTEAHSDIDTELYNSNVQNLAQAKHNAQRVIRNAKKVIEQAEAHIVEIDAFAEGGEDNILNTTKVHALFNKKYDTKDERW